MSRRQIIDYLTVNGHCSALVKVHPMCLYLVGTVTVEIRSRIVDRLLVLHTYTPSNGASILCIAFCPSLCLSVVPYVLVIQEEKVIDRKSSVAYFQKCFLWYLKLALQFWGSEVQWEIGHVALTLYHLMLYALWFESQNRRKFTFCVIVSSWTVTNWRCSMEINVSQSHKKLITHETYCICRTKLPSVVMTML